jgi:hypothetical protein
LDAGTIHPPVDGFLCASGVVLVTAGFKILNVDFGGDQHVVRQAL